MMKQSDEAPPCPYVGLQPFHEADREFFFGRDRDQRIISANLLSSPLTILYGSSGVGKSSLLMAGVIPYLRHEHPKIPVVIFREWASSDFQVALARACIDAVWKEDTGQPKPAETMPVDEILRACVEAAHDTILILFDQFEEYFLYHQKSSGSESFEAQFARAVNREDVCVGFLIALREDSLSKLDRFRERIPNLLSNRLILKHLDEDGAAAAVRRPLEVWNSKYADGMPPVTIEDGLVTGLIDQVRIGRVSMGRQGGSGTTQEEEHLVEAPFLQLVLTRLWAELEQKVKEANARALEKEKNNQRLMVLGCCLGVAFFIAAGFAFYAFSQKNRAMAFAAVGSSYSSREKDWQLSILLGLQALNLARSKATADALPRSESALLRALGNRINWSQLHEKKVRAVAFSRDGRLLATASGSQLQLWDAQTGKEKTPKPIEHAKNIQEIAFTGDGYRLVAGDDDGNVRLWDMQTGEDITPKPMQHGMSISALAVGPANLLATASLKNSSVIFWNLETGGPIASLPLKNGEWIADLAFNAEGSRLAVGEVNQGTTTVWDVSKLPNFENATPVFTLRNWQPDNEGTPESAEKMLVDAVAFSADGQYLATGDRFNTVNAWDAKTGAYLKTFWGHTDQIRKIAFSQSEDGIRLATTSADGKTKIWDVKSGRLLLSLSGHSLPIDDLAFSPKGDWLATVGQDKRINVWNVAIHSDAVITVAFSPDGKFLATGSGDKTIKIWKPDTLELVKTLGDHHNRTQKLAFSPPDGKFLASASFDKTARIWDWRMGTEVVPPLQYKDVKYGYDKVYDLAYSTGGQWLATAGANHNAVVWDAATGSFKFAGAHGGQVSAVAFSPDDKYLASAGWDGRVNIWEMPSGKFVASVCSPKGRKILDVNFNPDGVDLVMAMGTPTILVAHGWKHYLKAPLEKEPAGQEACQIAVTPLPGTERPIASMAQFTPDGKKIVTISKTDQMVKIWEASSAKEWKSIPVPAKVNDVAISRDGKWIAAAGEDMNFYLFPLNAADLLAWGCTRVTDRCLTDKECEDNLGYNCPANPCPTECSKEPENVPMH